MEVLANDVVELVPLAPGHLDDLVAAARAPGGRYEWTEVPLDHPGMERWIERALTGAASGEELPFTVVRRADDRVVGSTSYLRIDRWGGPPDAAPRTVEVGRTWYAGDVWGSTVNPACKLALLSHAFEVWQVERLWLKTDARNTRSRAAIERLGARFEGVLRSWEPGRGTLGAGTIRSTAVASILPDEWPEVERGLRRRLARPPGWSPTAPARRA